MATTLEE
jgi:hypothetical protein